MIRWVGRMVVGVLPACLAELGSAQTRQVALESAEGLRLHNVVAQPVTYKGRRGLQLVADTARLRERGAPGRPEPELLAVIDGVEFSNGWIGPGTVAHFRSLTVRPESESR